jgi:glycine cleavage system aminomethyltransferase T
MPEIVGDETVGQRYAINGLLSVTLDGMPLIGETPEVDGLWSAAAIWIKEGPGAGKTVAELMVNGESEIDVYESNIARAYPHQKTVAHIQARASEGFNKMYGIVHPSEQWESDRRVKLPPFYEREQELRAVFYEAAGWERPQWYESNAGLLEEYGDRINRREAEWESRWWSPIINAEHLAMRDRAGYTDLTAFAVFDVTGPGALDAVQRVAMRQMDVAVGRVVYTPILSPSGGFKADLTIMRFADDVFRVVTGGAWGMSDLKWFKDHLPADGTAQIHDQTNAWTTLGLWGPRARDILASVTSDDVSNEGFPFANFRTLEVGSLKVVASRISYVGDLGWELYVPIEQGAHLWDIIAEAGLPHGAVPMGAGVYGTTGRLEKCYRAYGAELEADYNVVEAGMAWGKVKAQDFVGKEAHVAQRETEPLTSMCTLTVEDHTSKSGVKRYMLGGEPILTRDGGPITDAHGRRSYVTSAGAGPSIGKHILMSYLPPEHAKEGEELLVQYMGERYPVTVAVAGSTPVFDPDNSRVRS